MTIRRISYRAQETILRQNRSTRVNIILQDTLTTSMVSVRILWQMHCEAPAMIYMELVDKDINAHLQDYDIEEPDINMISGE